MSQVRVYTMEQCPYCEAARALLKQRDIKFAEVKLSQDDDAAWDELYKKSKLKTVPQIFVGEQLIGGYTELAAQDKVNALSNFK